jgi:hypothetical protein
MQSVRKRSSCWRNLISSPFASSRQRLWLGTAPIALSLTTWRIRWSRRANRETISRERSDEPSSTISNSKTAWGSKTLALRVGLLSRGQFVLMDEAAEQLAPLDSS